MRIVVWVLGLSGAALFMLPAIMVLHLEGPKLPILEFAALQAIIAGAILYVTFGSRFR